MSVNDLYEYQREFTEWAASRLMNVGADQYDMGEKGQKFEQMPVEDLITALAEELADIVNYATMLDIMLSRVSMLAKVVTP